MKTKNQMIKELKPTLLYGSSFLNNYSKKEVEDTYKEAIKLGLIKEASK